MRFTSKYPSFIMGLLLLALLLAACGDNPTPVPATTAPATTAATTTQVATTVAATTAATIAAATTVAATTVPTTVAVTATPAGPVKLPYLVIGDPSLGGSLRYPYDGVLDKDGNLYIADFTTRKVVKFDKDGKFKNFIEPDPSQTGLAAPQYLAIDTSNNLYVLYYDGTFLKYDATGKSLGNFGDKTLGTIYSLTSDKNGNIYTVTGDDYLVKYDASGKVAAKYQSPKSGDKLAAGEFNYQAKVRVDPAGNIFLFEQYDPSRVQKFGADGKFLSALDIPTQKDGKPSSISDVVFDTQANIFVVNSEHLWKYDASGKLVSDTAATLYNAQRLYALADGTFLQISNNENHTGKIDASGKQQTVIGPTNSKAASQFEQASAIAVDKAGNIYVGDSYLDRIQKFDKSGKLLMTIDQSSSGQDFSPRYLVLDKSGNIYAAGSGSVVKFTPEGKPTLAFGKYGKEDGQFDNLSGLALDKNGNIYAGDAERGIIQKFSSSGAFLEKYSLKQKNDDRIYYISMLFDDAGNILVGRGNDNGILMLGSDGKIKGQFSPNNKLVTQLSIYSLAQDAQGTIYAIESSSEHPLAVIDKQGQLKSSTGGEGRNTLEFLGATAIALDDAGNVYVAEQNGARIQRWHPEDSTLKQGAAIPASSLIAGSPANAVPTAAATTAAVTTTKAATTTTATSGNSTASANFNLTISGVKEIDTGKELADAFAKQVPGVSNLTLKVYVSDDIDEKVAANADSALSAAGYQPILSSDGKLTKSGDSYGGIYSKTGGPDILITIAAVPTDEKELTKGMTGVSDEALQKLVAQVKGKKTAVFIVSAPDLVKTLFASATSTTPTPKP